MKKGVRQALPFDSDSYRNRNGVERCFGPLKEYGRITARYEKTAGNYLAMVKIRAESDFFTEDYVIEGHSLVHGRQRSR